MPNSVMSLVVVALVASTPIRPPFSEPYSVNQIRPSGPAVIPSGLLFAVGTGISRTSLLEVAFGVMRPTRLWSVPATSVNHRFPSGPAVMPDGETLAVGMGISSPAPICPAVVMRPILLPKYSVNHSRPSGPVVIPRGVLLAVGIGYSVIVPTSAADAAEHIPATASATTAASTGRVTKSGASLQICGDPVACM
jgi:hypothetical protein